MPQLNVVTIIVFALFCFTRFKKKTLKAFSYLLTTVTIICDHLSKNLTCLHKHTICIGKIEIKNIVKIMHATMKKMCKVLSGHYSEKKESNWLKLYTILFTCSQKVQKTFCSPKSIHVTCICLQCGNISKIVVISSTKPPSYTYV